MIKTVIFLVGVLVGWRGAFTFLQVQVRKGRFRDKYEFRPHKKATEKGD